MGQWVVTVAGIAIFSVLCDVILPEGQTRKYVKTVFGVVVTLVIVQPLIGLFSGNLDFLPSVSDDKAMIQEQYIQNVGARQNDNAVNFIKISLESNDITVASIAVSELNETVTLQLDVGYTTQFDAKVKEVVSKYFPKYEIVTVWK